MWLSINDFIFSLLEWDEFMNLMPTSNLFDNSECFDQTTIPSRFTVFEDSLSASSFDLDKNKSRSTLKPTGKGLSEIMHNPPSEMFMAFPTCFIVILTSILGYTLFVTIQRENIKKSLEFT